MHWLRTDPNGMVRLLSPSSSLPTSQTSTNASGLPGNLFLFLLRAISSSKGCLPKRHPCTRVSFLHQRLQADIGKRMLSSPPASLLPRDGHNRIRAGRRTKTQLKRVIQANVCLARRLCQNQFIADSQQ